MDGRQRVNPIGDTAARAVAALLAAAVLLAAAGCRSHADLVAARLDARNKSLATVINAVEQSEAQRPAGLRRTLDRVEQSVQIDLERTTQRDPAMVRGWVEGDVERFRTRQPVYRNTIERILAGRPERIGPNGINLFY